MVLEMRYFSTKLKNIGYSDSPVNRKQFEKHQSSGIIRILITKTTVI